MLQHVVLLALLILNCSALNSPKLWRGRLRQHVYGEEFTDFGSAERITREQEFAKLVLETELASVTFHQAFLLGPERLDSIFASIPLNRVGRILELLDDHQREKRAGKNNFLYIVALLSFFCYLFILFIYLFPNTKLFII